MIYTAESENVNIATATVSNETLTILAVDEGVSKITVTADDQLGGQVATDFDVTVTIVLSADGMPIEILTYPNPVTTDLTIKSDGFHISEWKLYGLRGDLRAEGHSSGATELVIDVRGFAAGTYILKLKSITDKTVDIRVRVNK